MKLILKLYQATKGLLIFISLMLLIALYGNSLFAQAKIAGVIPANGMRNQSINILVRGIETNFRQGATKVAFSEGITVNNINVIDNLTLYANITINTNASFGLKRMSITVDNRTIQEDDVFEILEDGKILNASIEVVPVQSLAMGDFDRKNLQSAPTLFYVNVFNDNLERNITVKFLLSSSRYGVLGTADKKINKLTPNALFRFDNRQFGNYDVSGASREFINKTMESGSLPADEYSYKILIYNEKGKLLAETEATNTITNPYSALQLISPGAAFTESPEEIITKLPVFQWFGQATRYDFALYQLDNSVQSPNELVNRFPIYKQENITQNTLVYPSSARILEEGATYAWQVTAYTTESRGIRKVYSEVWRFTIESPIKNSKKDKKSNDFIVIDRIEISPDEAKIAPGEKVLFKANFFDEKSQLVEGIKPEWKVVPAEAGLINSEGLFTANKKAMTFAVVAKYKNFQEYSTLMIVPGMPSAEKNMDFDLFFRQLFGLPKSN